MTNEPPSEAVTAALTAAGLDQSQRPRMVLALRAAYPALVSSTLKAETEKREELEGALRRLVEAHHAGTARTGHWAYVTALDECEHPLCVESLAALSQEEGER